MEKELNMSINYLRSNIKSTFANNSNQERGKKKRIGKRKSQ